MLHRTPTQSTIRAIGLEPIVWLGGLMVLGLFGASSETHFSICPLALAGLDFCPGCGLGRSIALLLNGELRGSIQAHWLGVPATVILLGRSLSLGIRNWQHRDTTDHHQH